MLRHLLAPQSRKPPTTPRIGLAVAGGGPLGGIFELGALRALEDCVDGLDLTDMHAYVGVSSGAFIAASLANQLSPGQMCRIFINNVAAEQPFKPELFLKPAFGEYFRRASRLPSVLWESMKEIARHPLDSSISDHLGRLSELVPSGIFDNDQLHDFLEGVFTIPGRTNDFRQLHGKLFIVAVDVDTGTSVRFGGTDMDHVPISRAVQASAALPGLYPPVEIDGRFFVDGALRRTLHASAALNEGVDLLIGINPLVPFDGTHQQMQTNDSLVRGGLPRVLSQTFRAMIQSRMEIGIGKYATNYPHSDLLLIEPNRNDARMFFTNVFSYADRKSLCEHAYQCTRADLRAQAPILADRLARFGLHLNLHKLEDPHRQFTADLPHKTSSNVLTHQLNTTLDRLELRLG